MPGPRPTEPSVVGDAHGLARRQPGLLYRQDVQGSRLEQLGREGRYLERVAQAARIPGANEQMVKVAVCGVVGAALGRWRRWWC